jgi:hypothetical protein
MINASNVTGRACVIISHYNAWPTEQLFQLLYQTISIPSGHPFRTMVVVNCAEDRQLELPLELSHVEIVYRPNQGYNIGAWEYGWRCDSESEYFLFLQEECLIRRPNWLFAFVQAMNRPGVGLVGELDAWNRPWQELEALGSDWNGHKLMEYASDGRRHGRFEIIDHVLSQQSLHRGKTGHHLQSIILASSRHALEKVDGFLTGSTKWEAIASEIAITKQFEKHGYQIQLVGYLPLTYIDHP